MYKKYRKIGQKVLIDSRIKLREWISFNIQEFGANPIPWLELMESASAEESAAGESTEAAVEAESEEAESSAFSLA